MTNNILKHFHYKEIREHWQVDRCSEYNIAFELLVYQIKQNRQLKR